MLTPYLLLPAAQNPGHIETFTFFFPRKTPGHGETLILFYSLVERPGELRLTLLLSNVPSNSEQQSFHGTF